MNKNQSIADRINNWDLPRDVLDIIQDTDINIMGDLFRDIHTPEELISFVHEYYTEED